MLPTFPHLEVKNWADSPEFTHAAALWRNWNELTTYLFITDKKQRLLNMSKQIAGASKASVQPPSLVALLCRSTFRALLLTLLAACAITPAAGSTTSTTLLPLAFCA